MDSDDIVAALILLGGGYLLWRYRAKPAAAPEVTEDPGVVVAEEMIPTAFARPSGGARSTATLTPDRSYTAPTAATAVDSGSFFVAEPAPTPTATVVLAEQFRPSGEVVGTFDVTSALR